jgi:hypothetical protein
MSIASLNNKKILIVAKAIFVSSILICPTILPQAAQEFQPLLQGKKESAVRPKFARARHHTRRF